MDLRTAAIGLLVLGPSASFGAEGSRRPSPTILDDYLSIPSRYLQGIDAEDPSERKRQIVSQDLQNGYLEAGESIPRFKLALFVKPDGTHLVAIWREGGSVCDSDGYQILFLDHRGGRWSDVTSEILRRIDLDKAKSKGQAARMSSEEREGFGECDPGALLWKLPRKGSEIVVSDAKQSILFRLRWNKGRFEIEPASLSK